LRLTSGFIVPRLFAKDHSLDGHEDLKERTLVWLPSLALAPRTEE
jgi:hypothetical protein